ncbi:phage shock protein C (PspC) family protein [Alkalibaculum bacchi]|jgi:phage shock protein PspC (stress-responsive transcriptional regulator)|uniref:Phage shock protein C (PspC) family protein n=1 Tax=Alkalibaculum bacchi TaxID=645887 RepID=A0A366I640_9FIRM|nr:PspC domain-containing protein [Alkalibaculum bacchi]RBP62573.1 phage shock protein C (PspC) family protein [Alkalibaculum bacchi]
MKRLYKNKAEGKISGVCQGVSEYFSIDPSIVRILWVVLSLPLVGLGLFLYIACAFILPDKSDLNFDDYTID